MIRYKAGESVAVPKPKTLNDWVMLGQSAAAPQRSPRPKTVDNGVMQPQDFQRLLQTEEMRKLFADAYGLPTPHSPPDIDPLGR